MTSSLAAHVSPLAPARFPAMKPVAGARFAVGNTGMRYRGRPDLLFVELAPRTTVAGVLTRSSIPSAPVQRSRKALAGGRARGLVVNAGIANAFTGRAGRLSVERTLKAAAKLLSCSPGRIFVASTGVIGVPLPDDKIIAILPRLKAEFDAGGWADAARAIMTTDTFPKGASRTCTIGGAMVTISGIAKGSGMIAPNMATMLSFIFTDATIPAPVLRSLLRPAADRSFNAITVDGDTSTSDTVLLFATGAGPRHPPVKRASGRLLARFRAALEAVMIDLAHQVVRDGEGATKFVAISVSGAASDAAARRIALSIANSPLVKTAIAGEDANWGRIVAAVGKAGEKVNQERLSVTIGGLAVAGDGVVVAGYDEAPVARHMRGDQIEITVGVGVGRGRATAWTCDLTHRYIDINADYRS